MQYAAKTDIGQKRKNNEDNCYACENFAVVADGMGGHNKGEVASKMTVDAIKKALKASSDKCSAEVLKIAIKDANRQVYAKSVSNASYNGMGTTVVACCWDDEKIIVANIGDSRCYEITEQGIHLVTKDHTLVQKLLDAGNITEKEAEDYPDKHVITKALGTVAEEEPDMFELTRKQGQILILCSDGLSNLVSPDEMLACVQEEKNAAKAAKCLVDMANNGGGLDNITAVVVRF